MICRYNLVYMYRVFEGEIILRPCYSTVQYCTLYWVSSWACKYERINWFYCRASVLFSIFFFVGCPRVYIFSLYTPKKNRHPTFWFWALLIDRGCTRPNTTKLKITENKTGSSFILISDQNPNPPWTAVPVVRSLFQFRHGGEWLRFIFFS